MDTSNNRMIDLETSQFVEDRELAKEVTTVVATLIEKLKPILRYIAAPVPVVKEWSDRDCRNLNFHYVNPYSSGYRAVMFPKDILVPELKSCVQYYVKLFLDQNGQFFTAKVCQWSRQEHYHLQRSEGDEWKYIILEELMQILQQTLLQTEEKREQHLQDIRDRREKLDKILEILKK